jgi:hypothetical protein
MRRTPPIKECLLLLLFNVFLAAGSVAQEIPLVYTVEHTGVDCTAPPLPAYSELPEILPLTDPFEWSDGSGRDTTFENWTRRRAEIKAEIEHYEIGPKPVRPDTITATYSDGLLTVNVTVNGKTLTLTSQVTLPEGEGPFPAMIGMGGGTGSLSSDIFTSRDIATIPFDYEQVMQHTQQRGTEPINALYPELTYMGAYSAWPWGVSRLIDGLELVQDSLPIDLEHLAVTGCSFAGKMALFAGALDERIALTIVQESGGGGAAAWRVSETLGSVEKLGSTNHSWFMEAMFQFSGSRVSRLPMDHHELITLVAPRALFIIGNPDYVWLAEESGYVSSQAARRVWDNFGISDRMGFSFVAGHPHCALPEVQRPEVEAFVDKFLLGDTTVNTDITTHSYDFVDYKRWTNWWGSDEPAFPERDAFGTETVWLEAECGTVGSNWTIVEGIGASIGFVTVNEGLNSTTQAPDDIESIVSIPFTVNTDSTFYAFARLYGAVDNDSYWVKMDDGDFVKYDGLNGPAWFWRSLGSYDLAAGEHTLSIAYSEDGARLDKLCISSYPYYPAAQGDTAVNICEPEYTVIPDAIDMTGSVEGYALRQNYPNPFDTKTNITFEIPVNTYVSLKVYNIFGVEIKELAGKEYGQGKHAIEFENAGLPIGNYFYTIETDNFSATRKMMILAK